MRVQFKASATQRHAIRLQRARLGQPETVLDVLRPCLPPDFTPASAIVTRISEHPDRFVMRVAVRSTGGHERRYALKVYSDDFGKRVWTLAQSLAGQGGVVRASLCLPEAYLPEERVLVFPWVAGEFLSDIVDERKPALLRQTATLAAALHRLPVVPDAPTTDQMMLSDTVARCERLRIRWPAMTAMTDSLVAALQEAFSRLDPCEFGPVHGDLSAGQLLWTGERLVLLDLDMFGYADPAYDAGHFLAQLERRCLLDATLPAHATTWVASFRDAYVGARPEVSPRNIAFYHGLTLISKIYTLCRRDPEEGPSIAPRLGTQAQAALQAVFPVPSPE